MYEIELYFFTYREYSKFRNLIIIEINNITNNREFNELYGVDTSLMGDYNEDL